MRPQILNALPETVSKNDIVFMAAAKTLPGLKHLNSLVHNLNRTAGTDWIKLEDSDQISGTSVPQHTAIAFTTINCKHGTLTNVRAAAKALKVPCPIEALSNGEAKEVLEILASRRPNENHASETNAAIVSQASVNGNSKSMETSDECIRLAAMTQSATAAGDSFAAVIHSEDLIDIDAGTSEDASSEAETPAARTAKALDTLENFRALAEETGIAILTIAEDLETLTGERHALKARIDEKDAEIVNLLGAVTDLRKTTSQHQATAESWEKKFKVADERAQRLQTSLDEMQTIFNRIRSTK